ncbi:hypothetical protein TNCV_5006411 [Trichonephila clavipes]|uniref:Uncharacterized protein n=1 Tax=Trichonephila clavipes TaxID=2585209 RepID=A0A8X6SC69_TRICX|nr:hypothetical protein TNCV_5006411 [Trichonephila clavipes]
MLAVRKTSHNHLDDSLRWRASGWVESGQSQAEVLDGFKWPESDFPVLESVPNKWYCQQKDHAKKDSILRSRKHKSWTTQECGRVLFSNESKCSRQSDSRRLFNLTENRALFHPSNVTKIDIFSGNGILVCGGIMLSSLTSLYLFDAGTVNSKDEILETQVRFFGEVWAQTAFLWTIMRGNTKLTLAMNFKKKVYSLYGLILEVSGS